MQSGSPHYCTIGRRAGARSVCGAGLCHAENSRGPNSLLKDGARLVESAQDILEELLPQLDVPFREQLSARVRDTIGEALS